jgi:hypothetical protein
MFRGLLFIRKKRAAIYKKSSQNKLILRRLGAAQMHPAGHMCPAGRVFETPALERASPGTKLKLYKCLKFGKIFV